MNSTNASYESSESTFVICTVIMITIILLIMCCIITYIWHNLNNVINAREYSTSSRTCSLTSCSSESLSTSMLV